MQDPWLGALLVPGYVRGVQSRGVACVAKHFALNSQETHRGSQSSDASDRTLWEQCACPATSLQALLGRLHRCSAGLK